MFEYKIARSSDACFRYISDNRDRVNDWMETNLAKRVSLILAGIGFLAGINFSALLVSIF